MIILGQINIGSILGDKLVEYASLSNVKNVVEIGTWNGMGSTLCIVEGLRKNVKDKIFISLETCLSKYQDAVKYYHDDWIKILHGIILDIDKITFDFSTLEEPQKTWAAEDLKNYKTCINVLNQLPERIDLLLLDGGEFTTYDEFMILKDRTNLFFLDDTMTLKNRKVIEYIEKDNSFQILYRNDKERNGIAIVRRL